MEDFFKYKEDLDNLLTKITIYYQVVFKNLII
jgi:hypothetical protein